jgi:hypothetical protein
MPRNSTLGLFNVQRKSRAEGKALPPQVKGVLNFITRVAFSIKRAALAASTNTFLLYPFSFLLSPLPLLFVILILHKTQLFMHNSNLFYIVVHK